MDVETIYTSDDAEMVKELIEKYEISYIFIGSCEYEKYEDSLNRELLESLGDVVYQDPVYDTCIIKVG
jgi:uncharacterized membrane protein